MKHLLVILFMVVLGYALWATTDKPARKSALQLITRHGLRLGGLVLIVLLLLAAAVNLPASLIL